MTQSCFSFNCFYTCRLFFKSWFTASRYWLDVLLCLGLGTGTEKEKLNGS